MVARARRVGPSAARFKPASTDTQGTGDSMARVPPAIQVTAWWEALLLGAAGGTVAEIIQIGRLSVRPESFRNAYFQSRLFWGIRVAFALTGGVVAFVFFLENELGPILAFTVGLAWPLFLGQASDVRQLPVVRSR